MKLSNHVTDFGCSDAVLKTGDLLLTSAYDLDNGAGYINGNFPSWICR